MRLCWKKYCAEKRVLFFIQTYLPRSAASLRLLRVSRCDWIVWIVLAERGKNTWHFVMLDSKDPAMKRHRVTEWVCRGVRVLSVQGGCSGPFLPYCVIMQQLGNLRAGGDTWFKPSLSWCKWVCKAGMGIPWPFASAVSVDIEYWNDEYFFKC